MNRTRILRDEAVQELDDAYHWYEQQRDGLGDEFLKCVEDALRLIDQMPEAFPVTFDSHSPRRS